MKKKKFNQIKYTFSLLTILSITIFNIQVFAQSIKHEQAKKELNEKIEVLYKESIRKEYNDKLVFVKEKRQKEIFLKKIKELKDKEFKELKKVSTYTVVDTKKSPIKQKKEVELVLPKGFPKPKNKFITFDVNDVTVISNVSAERFRQIVKASGKVNLAKEAESFIKAEETYGINAFFLAAIGVSESTDFGSNYANSRNNGFGMGANTENPNNAYYYSSKEASIMHLAETLMLKKYYVADGVRTIRGISRVYCPDNSSTANNEAYEWESKVIKQLYYWRDLSYSM